MKMMKKKTKKNSEEKTEIHIHKCKIPPRLTRGHYLFRWLSKGNQYIMVIYYIDTAEIMV